MHAHSLNQDPSILSEALTLHRCHHIPIRAVTSEIKELSPEVKDPKILGIPRYLMATDCLLPKLLVGLQNFSYLPLTSEN